MDSPEPPATSPAPRRPAVLYVDDEEQNLELFRLSFGDDFDVRTASSGAQALELMPQRDIGLLLTDERMPRMSGIELLARVHEHWPETVRVIVSAYSDPDRLFRAINVGHVHEYLLKPWEAPEMRACIERGLARAKGLRKLASDAAIGEVLTADLRIGRDPEPLIGAGGGLKDVVTSAWKAAQCDSTVLIRGETGTGKELIAKLIHKLSPRASERFVDVNCGALSESVLESELFGHERGAFTDAIKMRRGWFELARGGTILLDEIGDVSSKFQVSLLRVLEKRRIYRVGGSEPIDVDVRVIAATHRNLEALIEKDKFREDLFYRLNVVPIKIPPLRERSGDIGPLLDHFIAKYSRGIPRRLSSDAREALTRYDWPGNVRELQNFVERAANQSVGDDLQLEDFEFKPSVPKIREEARAIELQRVREPLLEHGGDIARATGDLSVPEIREKARETETERYRGLMIKHGGNITRAAVELGVPRTTLVSRLKKYGLI